MREQGERVSRQSDRGNQHSRIPRLSHEERYPPADPGEFPRAAELGLWTCPRCQHTWDRRRTECWNCHEWPPESPATTLADLGITRDHASRAMQLAEVPAEEFEAALAEDRVQHPRRLTRRQRLARQAAGGVTGDAGGRGTGEPADGTIK
jgi:hypothetical protein